MTPRQASKILGVSYQRVIQMIRNGTITARRIVTNVNDRGHESYTYDITPAEACRVRDLNRKPGRPRGKPA